MTYATSYAYHELPLLKVIKSTCLSLVEGWSWAYFSPEWGAGLPFDGGVYQAYSLPGQVDGGLVPLQCPARRTTPFELTECPLNDGPSIP